MSWLPFWTVIVALDLLIHGYLFMRWVYAPDWSMAVKVGGGLVLLFLAIALPVGMLAHRLSFFAWGGRLTWIGAIWMGTILYLVLFTAALDGIRLVTTFGAGLLAWWAKESLAAGPDPVRRALMSQGVANAVGLAAVTVSGVALRSGLEEVEVREREVRLERLPRTLSGLTIVQLSDVHIGPTLGRRFVETIVEKTNALKPDLIVITGDLVDGRVSQLEDAVSPLAQLRARFGTYFVHGNHEYYSGVRAWEKEVERLGMRLLVNERVSVGDAGGSFDLAGVDDYTGRRLGPKRGPQFAPITKGRDPDRALVLLAHQPKAIHQASESGVELQLSGHTHGGQLWPFSAVVRWVQPYLGGLYRHDARTQIYVSRGTGYWGPPMRFLAPSEITKIVLV